MLHYSASGGTDKSALAIVTVDSPRIILSIDPLAALLDFAIAPFKNASADSAEGDAPLDNDDDVKPQAPQTALAFRIEVANATVVVLASDTDPKTQAIQLSIREVIMSQQVGNQTKVLVNNRLSLPSKLISLECRSAEWISQLSASDSSMISTLLCLLMLAGQAGRLIRRQPSTSIYPRLSFSVPLTVISC